MNIVTGLLAVTLTTIAFFAAGYPHVEHEIGERSVRSRPSWPARISPWNCDTDGELTVAVTDDINKRMW